MRRKRAISLLVGVLLAMSVAPAGSALADEGIIIEIGDEARLVSKGAMVSVPVDISCAPDSGDRNLFFDLAQRRGHTVVNGSNSWTWVVCDGTVHTYDILVWDNRSLAFKKGVALATADFTVCSPSCKRVSDLEEITIR